MSLNLVEIVLNVFYSEIKYKDHIEYCQFRKAKKLMSPFKKYMKFENLKKLHFK